MNRKKTTKKTARKPIKATKTKSNYMFKVKTKDFLDEVNNIFGADVDHLIVLCNGPELVIGGKISRNMIIKIHFKNNKNIIDYNQSDEWLMAEKKDIHVLLKSMDGEDITFSSKVINNKKMIVIKSGKLTHKIAAMDNQAEYNTIVEGFGNTVDKISGDLNDHYTCHIENFSKPIALSTTLPHSDSIIFASGEKSVNVLIKPLQGSTSETDLDIDVIDSNDVEAVCAIHKMYIKGFKIMKDFDMYFHDSKPLYAYKNDESIIRELIIASQEEDNNENDDDGYDYEQDTADKDDDDYEEEIDGEDFDLEEE